MAPGTFYCRGTDIGGDCDELRIQSRSSNDYHEVDMLWFMASMATTQAQTVASSLGDLEFLRSER